MIKKVVTMNRDKLDALMHEIRKSIHHFKSKNISNNDLYILIPRYLEIILEQNYRMPDHTNEPIPYITVEYYPDPKKITNMDKPFDMRFFGCICMPSPDNQVYIYHESSPIYDELKMQVIDINKI